MPDVREVLGFWFGEPRGARRLAWFAKDTAFDAEARARFLRAYCAAARSELSGWQGGADSALALIILTDQLPRNMFRGTPLAFATDSLALACARRVVAAGWDKTMRPAQRMFAYLPFEHSEVLADQDRALELFAPLAAFEETADAPEFARKHWKIVKRFGRFPHRNDILGRASSAEEIEFLKQPGSGF